MPMKAEMLEFTILSSMDASTFFVPVPISILTCAVVFLSFARSKKTIPVIASRPKEFVKGLIHFRNRSSH